MTEETQVIECKPKWAGILPLLRMGLENGNTTGQAIAWEEIARMAEAADKWNERVSMDEMRRDHSSANAEADKLDGAEAAKRGATVHVNPYDHGSARACNWLIGFGNHHAEKRREI